MIPRLFIEKERLLAPDRLKLDTALSRYLFHVLRLDSGKKLECVLNENELWEIQICSFSKNDLVFDILKKTRFPLPPLTITIAQALPKQDKFSDILRACVEFGVARFIPLLTRRTIPVLKQSDYKRKHQRWEGILLSAASQSRQNALPKLYSIMSLPDFATQPPEAYHLTIVLWENEKQMSLKRSLSQFSKSLPKKQTPVSICVVVGPEGGFSEEEIERLKEKGFESVSLGQKILRVEHAAFAACCALFYHFES